MTGEEIVALSKKHTIFEWSAQSAVDPIPVARAKGVYFWTPEGKRFIDFNSQLMCVNIGHGDARVIKAIQEQAATLAYANPFMATERARGSARSWRRSRRATSTSSSSPTAAPRPTRTRSRSRARSPAARRSLARYRSYHGGTAGAIAATGDPRRWVAERRHAGRRPRARPVSRHRARLGRHRGALALPRRSDPARGAADDRRLHPRAGHRHQRHPRAARRLSAGRARALRQVRHPDDCRRGDGRLRPHRRSGSPSTTGTSSPT